MFDVTLEPSRIETITGISAGIVIDLGDDRLWVTGILSFFGGPVESSGWLEDSYVVRAGSGSVLLEVDPKVIAALGDGYKAVFEAGIRGSRLSGYPVLELSPPFRWATDDEISLQMEVSFETFTVQRGCGELASACSGTHIVQVIPLEASTAPAPSWDADQRAWIESPGSRPVSDPSFFDPGPLGPRWAHDVIWTGQEMIVWGGASGDRVPHLVEGAAFDPTTNEWRVIPPPPIEPDQATRAVQIGDEMLVMSREALVSYSPSSDVWRVTGGGFPPAIHPGMTVVTDDHVYTWTVSGIVELEIASGNWRELPRPGFGGFDPFSGALRTVGDTLVAIGSDDGICEGRAISHWTGTAWNPFPEVSLATAELADCSGASQVAAIDHQLVIWDDLNHPAMAFDVETGGWSEIPAPTLSGTEGPLGPVLIGDRVLVVQYGEASIYDPSSMEWTAATPPGSVNGPSELVWTGEEVLMWGAACCHGDVNNRLTSQDAWRWEPPR